MNYISQFDFVCWLWKYQRSNGNITVYFINCEHYINLTVVYYLISCDHEAAMASGQVVAISR